MAQVYNHDWFQKYTREDPEDPEDPIKVQVLTPIEIQSEFMKRRVAVDAEHERLFLVE